MLTTEVKVNLSEKIWAKVLVYFTVVHEGGCGEGPEFDICEYDIMEVCGTTWMKVGYDLDCWMYELVHDRVGKKLDYSQIYDNLLAAWGEG